MGMQVENRKWLAWCFVWPFADVGLKISIKPLGNDGEIDLSKEGG